MRDQKIVIQAMGHYHPNTTLDNAFFDELGIGSDAEWILSRTGIRERRSVLTKEQILALKNGTTTLDVLRRDKAFKSIADLAEESYQNLKNRFNDNDNTRIDLVIAGTSVPDFDIPANAATIAARLKWQQAVSFDVNSACSSFVVNMMVASDLLRSGRFKKAALFNPERYSLRMNFNDRRNAILFGDGSSATLVEVAEDSYTGHGLELVDVVIFSDPMKYDAVRMEVGEFFEQDGSIVQKFAITETIRSTKNILARNNLSTSDINYFVFHQANLRMLESSSKRLGIEEHKHLYNIDKFGNQGASGAPSVLSMNWGKFKAGDLIVVTVVGSGLTWGSLLLRKG